MLLISHQSCPHLVLLFSIKHKTFTPLSFDASDLNFIFILASLGSLMDTLFKRLHTISLHLILNHRTKKDMEKVLFDTLS